MLQSPDQPFLKEEMSTVHHDIMVHETTSLVQPTLLFVNYS